MEYLIEQHDGVSSWRRATAFRYPTREDALAHAEKLHSTPAQPLRVVKAPYQPSDRDLTERDDVPDSVASLGLGEHGIAWPW